MLLALLVPGALAAPKLPAGTITLSDAVEVPLYAGLDANDPYWYVEVKVGETPLLLRVSTGTQKIMLTEAAAKKVSVKGSGKEKKGSLKELSLGTAKITGVAVYVGNPDGGGGTGVDGEIALGAFPELSWAILPSAGVLRVGPAAKGAEWVGSLGEGMAYTTNPNEKIKVGKEKKEREDAPYVVTLTWDGTPIPTELASNMDGADLAAEATDTNRWWSLDGVDLPTYPLAAAQRWTEGGVPFEARTVAVGTSRTILKVARPGYGLGYATRREFEVGMSLLGNHDLAIDAAGKKLAMKPISTRKLADYGATYEAKLRKGLEAAPGKDGQAAEPDAVKEARAGGIPALADWLASRGNLTEATSLSKELTDLKPELCTSWMTYGTWALESGQPSEAAAAFQKAGDLYEPWAKKPLAERQKLGEDYAKAQKSKASWGDVVPQDHTCHVAWGRLASARIAAGQADKVAELYPAKLDLDTGLPTAAGIAYLVRGDSAAAEAAFRQAIHLNPRDVELARYGLFLAIGNRSLANAQVSDHYIFDADVKVASAYAEAIRKIEGGPQAVEALRRASAQNAANPALRLELARQYAREGNADEANKAASGAEVLLTEADAAHSRDAETRASWVLYLLVKGDTAGATAAADQLVKDAPGAGIAWWAASQAAEAAGDAGKAGEYARRAGMVAAGNPLYAVALAR